MSSFKIGLSNRQYKFYYNYIIINGSYMNIIINFKLLNPTVTDLAIKLVMILSIPLFLALLIKGILMKFMKE